MPWFKNMMIYRLNRNISLVPGEVEKQLAHMAFRPCSSQEKSKMGWVSPIGSCSQILAHVSNGQLLLCARKEEKILPAPVINQNVETRIEKLETEQHRKLKKSEKQALRDEVLHSLLPRAFSRFSQTYLWIDPIRHLIAIDCASPKKAEDLLALLRKSLGSLPVVPLTPKKPIELTLTEWVRSGNLASGFSLLDEAELKDTLEEGGIIRCKKQLLVSDEIAHHIEAGKRVTKVALDWQQRVQMVLADNASLKRLKFSDSLLEENDDIDNQDIAQRFDANFVLMTGELVALIADLQKALDPEDNNGDTV